MVYKSNEKTKDGRCYFFRVKHKDIFGRTIDYHSKKYLTRKEAVDEELKYKLKVSSYKTNNNDPTFYQIYLEYKDYRSKTVKPQTIIKYDYYYRYLSSLDNKKVNSFNYDMFKKLNYYLDSQKVQNEYKNKIISLLKNLIIYSNKIYNTSLETIKFFSTYKGHHIKKEMLFYTLKEYKEYRSVIKNDTHLAFFDTLYFLGLRKGEAQALNFKDIKGRSIYITKTLTTKIKGLEYSISTTKTTSSVRELPIPNFLYQEYLELYKKAKHYSDYSDDWFIFGNTVPFKDTTIDKYNRKYSALSNQKRIRIHDFRHSCASYLLQSGASITLVSKYLGHSKVSTTLNIYSHFYQNELDDIIKNMNKCI